MWTWRSSPRPTRTALVLSGGGFLGSAQVGCLEVLVRAGFRPDIIVGTSAGALNGSFFSAHPDDAGLEQLREMWLQADPVRVLGRVNIRVLLRVLAGRDYVYSNRELLAVLSPWAERRVFEDLAIPTYAVATELSTGSRAVFSTGPLLPALIASAAVPGMFAPIEIGGERYVDGSVVGHASLDTAYEQGAEAAVVLHIAHQMGPTGYGPLKTMAMAARMAVNRACDLEREKCAERMSVFWLEPPIPSAREMLGNRPTEQVILEAAQYTEEYLGTSEGERFLSTIHAGRAAARSR